MLPSGTEFIRIAEESTSLINLLAGVNDGSQYLLKSKHLIKVLLGILFKEVITSYRKLESHCIRIA